jgi:hypothetical protein
MSSTLVGRMVSLLGSYLARQTPALKRSIWGM